MKTVLSLVGLLLVAACDYADNQPSFEAEMPATGVIRF